MTQPKAKMTAGPCKVCGLPISKAAPIGSQCDQDGIHAVFIHKMTPGPWEQVIVGFHSGRRWYQIVSSGRGVVMCADDDSPEANANARAIACLPDLVEAARAALQWIEEIDKMGSHRPQPETEALRRILARIDGETEVDNGR